MDITFLISGIIFIGAFCQWVAWKMRIPAILFLLISGITLGPLLGILDSDKLFGDLLFPIITLSVSIILFEGGLTLRMHEMNGISSVVKRLVSVGALVTCVITTVATHYVMDLSWSISVLFGSITVVTGPTVIVPMLRTIRPTRDVSNILRWEGIIIDPIGAFLAVIVFEFIQALALGRDPLMIGIIFIKLVAVGFSLGGVSAYIYGILLKKHIIPEYLKNVATLALVVFVFALSNLLQHESGILSVTIMGMWLANLENVEIDEILDFKESLSVLLISIIFVVLASRINVDEIIKIGPRVLIILAIMQFVSRPLSIWISTINSPISTNEKHLLSWIAPRGIVAAAISALFSMKLIKAGYAGAEVLVPLTFIVIIFTVAFQSFTSRWFALRLGLTEVFPRGIILIGSNILSLSIARELKELLFRPVIIDANWDNIKKARMEGYETYYGSAATEHASKNLDLTGVGIVCSLSPHSPTNLRSMNHFKNEIGSTNVYTVLTDKDNEIVDSRREIHSDDPQVLFFGKLTYSQVIQRLKDGWELKSTTITESFTEKDFDKQLNEDAIKIFAISKKGKIEVFSDSVSPKLAPDSTIISMVLKNNGVNLNKEEK